ncbi:hypothetical protein [Gimesia maris]|uniref:hypothetical protein n=1 Tax=Gimesia maris TaxID=122 RepID=UPI00241CAACA|nr:hypothetical protein [Gimesia maris]|tara:strand:- start:1911 stop:2753 length:843 start_codon:yes stop_codon:yes gene_type:complete
MQETRYTEKQIMRFLMELLVDMYGLDDEEAPDPVADIDLRIDLYFKEIKLWKELDFADFMFRFERAFHIECSQDEWKELFGVAQDYQTEDEWINQVGQHLTFRKLVDFIAERSPYISFQPVMVIDRECGPAGAFYGMQELSEKFYPAACRFTPSTRILDAFRGNSLDRFWNELNWRNEYQIPDISRKWDDLFLSGCLLAGLGVLVGIPLSILTGHYLYVVLACVSLIVFSAISSIYQHYSDPLPPGLQTFRDLAVLIADQNYVTVDNNASNTYGIAEGLT